jgi:hypothetical protein
VTIVPEPGPMLHSGQTSRPPNGGGCDQHDGLGHADDLASRGDPDLHCPSACASIQGWRHRRRELPRQVVASLAVGVGAIGMLLGPRQLVVRIADLQNRDQGTDLAGALASTTG